MAAHPPRSQQLANLALPGLVVAIVAVVVAIIGFGIAPGIGLVLGGLGIGMGLGYWLDWRRLRNGRNPLADWPSALARGVALSASLSGALVVVVPMLRRAGVDLIGGSVWSTVQLLLLGACAGVVAGHWLDWVQARSFTVSTGPLLAPALVARSLVAAVVAASLVIIPLYLQPPAPAWPQGPAWCPGDATAHADAHSAQLLVHPLALRVAPHDVAGECYQGVDPHALEGKSTLHLSYDLHGLTALPRDASAIIFHQGSNDGCVNRSGCRWHYISLADYGHNGMNGVQNVPIPLSRFGGLDLNQPLDGTFQIRFWSPVAFGVDIVSMYAT